MRLITKSCARRIARGGWAEDAEEGRCTFPIGPRNTYSNVAYALAAGGVVAWGSGDIRWVMAAALLLLALGSALYHGYKTIWANDLDWAGMYATLTVLVVNGMFPNAPGLALGAASIGIVLVALFAFHTHFDAHMAILLAVAAGATMVTRPPERTLEVVGSLCCFVVAYGVWQLDKQRHPAIGRWGHAVWHVLTAAAMMILFLAQR